MKRAVLLLVVGVAAGYAWRETREFIRGSRAMVLALANAIGGGDGS